MSTATISTYVQNLYQNVLLRTGETAGVDYWVAQGTAGMAASDMAKIFIESAQNVTAVLHLYNVFFNRAPDSAGLTYWVNALNSGASLRDIANSFSATSEFQTQLASVSTADYVESMYSNLFGRASDAAGKAYWVQQIDSNVMSRAEVGLAFTLSDGTHLSTSAATRFAESYLVLRASGTTEPSTSAVEALATKTLATALAEKVTNFEPTYSVTGKLVDGYISGATVFADRNGDGIWNAGEATATTDAKGSFTLDGAQGSMIASGGTDLSTGNAFKGVLKATAGSTTINPLTTLQQGFVEKGQSIDQAELSVARALGLDASKFDLTTFEPLAASLNFAISATERALGAQAQAQAAKVANFMVAAGQTLTGAAGGADKLDALTANKSLLAALVNAITADSDGVVSFSDQAMLQSIMNQSVTLSVDADLIAASAKVAGMADEFAAMSAASADNVDKAFAAGGSATAMMVNIAQAQVVAQGAMADQLLVAAAGGDLTTMQASFTGTAFDTAADKAVVVDLDPNSTLDDAAWAESNAAVVVVAAAAVAAAAAAVVAAAAAADAAAVIAAANAVAEAAAAAAAAATAAAIVPTLLSSAPADNATGILVGGDLVLTFSENIALGTGNIVLKKTTGDVVVETFNVATGAGNAGGTVTASGTGVTINPGGGLTASTEYYVTVAATAVKDTTGNAYVGITSTTALSFTTRAAGTAFNLVVVGSESITGDAGDNTITAATFNNSDTGTFNPADTISGGTGFDTLDFTDTVAQDMVVADSSWANVTGIEKIMTHQTAAGALDITAGANFNTAFATNGAVLTTQTGLAGASVIDMSAFTGNAIITATTGGAGAHTITTGSTTGISVVTSTTFAGAQTIKGGNLVTVVATSTGAGVQTIGDGSGGGANLVTVTAVQNGSGNQIITSTSASAVTVVATNAGTAGNQTITTGAGSDLVTATTWGGTNIISTAAGNDTITLLAGVGVATHTITGGAGNDTITLVNEAAVDKIIFSGGTTNALTLAANGKDTITNFGATDTINIAALGNQAETVLTGTLAAPAVQSVIADGAVYIINTAATAGALTTGGSAAVTDYTNMAQVAAFLSERFSHTSTTADIEGVFAWNVGTTSYIYNFDSLNTANTTIDAAEVSLVGTITQGAALVTGNIVFA